MNHLSNEAISTITLASALYERDLERKLTETLHAEDLARYGIYAAYLKDLSVAIQKCSAGIATFTLGEISQMILALDLVIKSGGTTNLSRVEYAHARAEVNSLTPMS